MADFPLLSTYVHNYLHEKPAQQLIESAYP